jgi:hypothetical protein
MEYDKDKVDDMTMALLYLVMTKGHESGRAAKSHDWETMRRLHQKGWIAESKIKDLSVEVTREGMRKSEELFRKHFEKRG